MSDHEALESLQRLASQVTSGESELRQKINQISNSLITICEGIDIHASSESIRIWECEPTGDFNVGHFAFSSDQGIIMLSCDSDDIMADALNPDPFGPSYNSGKIDDVPVEWLQRAVDAGKLTELLQDIGKKLDERHVALNNTTEITSRYLSNPTLAIGTTFTDVAQQIGYLTVVQDWGAAVDDIITDPESAIGRACSLVESVCKHLLSDLEIELPKDKSIHPLFRATANAIGLDPAGQADPELKGICHGLASVAQNLGTLRTKFSTAHGNGPDDTPLTPAHARLAVNAAGNISTFLMEMWQLKKQNEKSS